MSSDHITEHLNIAFGGLRISGQFHAEGSRKTTHLNIQRDPDAPGSSADCKSSTPSKPFSEKESGSQEECQTNAQEEREAEASPESDDEVSAASNTTLPASVGLLVGKLRGPLGGFSPRGRINRAWKAGLSAAKVLEGSRRRVSPTPPYAGRVDKAAYVAIPKDNGKEPITVASWKALKEWFDNQGILQDDAVFHGFPTKPEAEAYSRGAGLSSLPKCQ